MDDGSTDQTEQALRPFLDRIVYRRIPNRGVGAARNEGVRLAKNPLVAFLDSDDEWLPGKMEAQRRLLSACPDVLFCFSDAAHRYPTGETRPQRVANKFQTDSLGSWVFGEGEPYTSLAPLPNGWDDFSVHFGDLYPVTLATPCVYTQTAMVRKSHAGDVLRFPEDISWCEDWECFSRLARHGRAALLDRDTAVIYVKHGEPQLTHSEFLYRVDTRITVMSRIWGEDQAFLSSNADRFARELDKQRTLRTRQLLRAGRKRDAREEIRRMSDPPILLGALALVPAPLTRTMTSMRRLVLKRLNR